MHTIIKMNVLASKKSYIFHTKLYPSLVRTETIADGSCFYHVICHALFREYRDLSDMDQRSFAHDIRLKVYETLTLDTFKILSNGEVFRLQFINNLRFVIQNTRSLLRYYDFSYWDNQILPMISKEWNDTDIESVERIISPYLQSFKRIRIVLDITEKITFNSFKRHIQTEWVDELGMELISRFFKCNFFFFHSTTRMPYHTQIINESYRRNIVFLWVNDTHFENIGELCDENHIKRIFTNRDKLILTIKTYLNKN